MTDSSLICQDIALDYCGYYHIVCVGGLALGALYRRPTALYGCIYYGTCYCSPIIDGIGIPRTMVSVVGG